MAATRSTHQLLAVALGVTALLGLAGCAEDDPEPSGATSTTATAPSTSVDPAGGPQVTGPDGAPVTTGPAVTTAPDGDGDPAPGTTAPRFGDLAPINAGAPIRVISCEHDDGHMVAVVELDNITDLPLEARVEVLFEDEQAVERERAIGEIDVIAPGESGRTTVRTADEQPSDTSCLLIGLERHEIVDG